MQYFLHRSVGDLIKLQKLAASEQEVNKLLKEDKAELEGMSQKAAFEMVKQQDRALKSQERVARRKSAAVSVLYTIPEPEPEPAPAVGT